ncbi:hypothetical protein J6590_077282 [Homalodisca vitripennis]|nr:hypothetical protein J6590_077282 [Homalodisca vitripennis]
MLENTLTHCNDAQMLLSGTTNIRDVCLSLIALETTPHTAGPKTRFHTTAEFLERHHSPGYNYRL